LEIALAVQIIPGIHLDDCDIESLYGMQALSSKVIFALQIFLKKNEEFIVQLPHG
tara:strand:+ start:815 stop:979 length:165 start_codon:yes stop_codon:yes gene_type:complete